MSVFVIGDVVAIGMRDGRCPVGMVESCDGEFVTLSLISFLTGFFGHERRSVRVADVSEVSIARKISLAEAKERGNFILFGEEDESTQLFDTKPLEAFQYAWFRDHAAGVERVSLRKDEK